MPSNLVSPYNSSNSVDLNDLSDSDVILQVVEEFLTLSEDRFMLLFHHSESSWEMIGCLSPMPFIKPEVIDLSSDDEEAVPTALHQPPSSSIHRPVWTNPDLQYVLNMVDPIIPNYSAHQLLTNPELSHVLRMVDPAVSNYDAHQSVTATPLLEIPRFDLSIFNINESAASENQPLFQCSVCQREMSSKGSLAAHMKTHDPKFKRKCPDPSCPYVTHRKDHMNRHVENNHPTLIEGPIYICPTCPKKFRSASSNESHIKKCCGITMFSCPSCDYVSKYRGNLNIHQRKHHSLLRELLSDRSSSTTPPTDQFN